MGAMSKMRHRLPGYVRFGNLKTDLQGMDFDALVGAGAAIQLFDCVTMELWGRRHKGDLYHDPTPYMASHGFLPIHTTFHTQLVRKRRPGSRHNESARQRPPGYRFFDLDDGNFAAIDALHFFNVKRLMAGLAASASAWPDYCNVPDGKVRGRDAQIAARSATNAAQAVVAGLPRLTY